MASYAYHQEPSAPPMYPIVTDRINPIPPVRSEFIRDPQEQTLLPPKVPERMDKPSTLSYADTGLRRNDNEENTGDINNDCTCNYNRYATKKTIGHALLEFALLTSNAMQLRTLILQKHHDGVWIACLVLVCVSIIIQFGLAVILYVLIKGDIRNPQKQTKLERYNTFALSITAVVSIINIIINILMLTTDPKSFLDERTLEFLQQQQKIT